MTVDYPPKQKPYSRNGEILEAGVYPSGMHRIALLVEYNGAAFHGFQRQKSGVASVQQSLETALSQVAAEPITLVCAGRTDAGVHGCGQVIHFDTLASRPDKAWTFGVNAHLPDQVSVRWGRQVSEYFHARFSATQRTYRYVIYNGATRPALAFDQLTWERRPLDTVAMEKALACLIGEHDFTSFRASQCQARSPVRTIQAIKLVRRGELVVLEVQANAFLHHMVRNIVGALIEVGRGDRPWEWVQQVLRAKDRTCAGVTAPPQGLYLVAVGYPERFELPVFTPGPWFIQSPLGGLSGS